MRRRLDNQDYFVKCAIPGCGRPTMRAAATGLAPFHCRFHVEHRARHGSHWHNTYRASELKPYLATAARWIGENRNDHYIQAALTGLRGLMELAGRVEIATRLRGMPPQERAKVALARLREAGIMPERLLTIHLAVSALIEEDPGSHRIREFRIVQVAKAAHRLASGYHKIWDVPQRDGSTAKVELHAYPRSSGRVLRHLGSMIEKECELIAGHYLADVLALKVKLFGPHPAIPRAENQPPPLPGVSDRH